MAMKIIFNRWIWSLLCLALCMHSEANASEIFDAEIFKQGKPFISSSSHPTTYLKFDNQNFKVYTYNKGDRSLDKEIGEIKVSYTSDSIIRILLWKWLPQQSNVDENKHKREAIETVISLCRGKHCKNHFSCETTFLLSGQNLPKALVESMGFFSTEGLFNGYILPFKFLELGKFEKYDLKLPRNMETNEGNQFPYYGPIENFVWEDLDQHQKAKAPFVWCDLACGTGLFPLRLLEKSDYITVIASDYEKGNLQVLRDFKEQAEKKSYKKEILTSLHIIEANLTTIKINEGFKPFIQKGIDRFSLLNVPHYLSPLHNILALAAISEILPNKGRVYITHDTDKAHSYDMQERIPYLEKCVDEEITVGCISRIPHFEDYMQKMRLIALINFLKDNNLEFPEYINSNVIDYKDYNDFSFSPSFMLEIAEAVGLKLLHKGESLTTIQMQQNILEYKDSQAGEGTKAWYVFEKEFPAASTASKEINFRNDPKFKKLAERALLADTQRKSLKERYIVNIANVYPFIQIEKKTGF